MCHLQGIVLPSLGRLPSQIHPLVFSWFASAFVCIFVPLITFWVGNASVQRQQENNGDNNGNQQNNNNNNYCHWWQWGCNRNYYNNNQEDNQDNNQNNNQNNNNEDAQQSQTPWWWFFTSSEEDGREMGDRNNNHNPAMVFVYVWTLLLFSGIVYFGYRQLHNGSDLYRLSAVLCMFANVCFLSLFFLVGSSSNQGGGYIQTDGPELQEQGFYAQLGVLMFLTYLACLLFSVVFGIIFYVRAKKQGVTKIFVDETDYQIHHDEQQQQHPCSEKDSDFNDYCASAAGCGGELPSLMINDDNDKIDHSYYAANNDNTATTTTTTHSITAKETV